MIIFFVSIFFIVLVFAITAIFYLQTRKRHNKRRDKALYLLEQYDNIPRCLVDVYKIINQRRNEHIMTFFNFQLLNKISGFLGVLFSLLSLISCFTKYINYDKFVSDYDELVSLFVSFISILCVIVALYASPNKRVTEYINAWREDEEIMNTMTSELSSYHLLTPDEAKAKAEKYIYRISEIERTLKSDEE